MEAENLCPKLVENLSLTQDTNNIMATDNTNKTIHAGGINVEGYIKSLEKGSQAYYDLLPIHNDLRKKYDILEELYYLTKYKMEKREDDDYDYDTQIQGIMSRLKNILEPDEDSDEEEEEQEQEEEDDCDGCCSCCDEDSDEEDELDIDRRRYMNWLLESGEDPERLAEMIKEDEEEEKQEEEDGGETIKYYWEGPITISGKEDLRQWLLETGYYPELLAEMNKED